MASAEASLVEEPEVIERAHYKYRDPDPVPARSRGEQHLLDQGSRAFPSSEGTLFRGRLSILRAFWR